MILTIPDIHALADRLYARGSSRMYEGRPETAGDMRTAAAVIRALADRLAASALVRVDAVGGGNVMGGE